MTLREQLAARKAERKHVIICGLGVIAIRRVTTQELLAVSGQGRKEDQGLLLVTAAALDEEGQPLFASLEEAREADWEVMQQLIPQVTEFCGITDAKVEEAQKN